MLFKDVKEFMFTGNVAKTSAGYAIGVATADFAKTITFSLLIPIIRIAWGALTLRASTAWNDVDVSLVMEHLLYWFCVIFVAYFLAELFFSRTILGIKTTIDSKEKTQLQISEHEARKAGTTDLFVFTK
jgi:large-conductance mechanosensitive channel